ncbi:MAG: hypothetical protein R2789_15710 [Microthrixaceae bacterium]
MSTPVTLAPCTAVQALSGVSHTGGPPHHPGSAHHRIERLDADGPGKGEHRFTVRHVQHRRKRGGSAPRNDGVEVVAGGQRSTRVRGRRAAVDGHHPVAVDREAARHRCAYPSGCSCNQNRSRHLTSVPRVATSTHQWLRWGCGRADPRR